jgi:hypothetical protein
MEGGCLAVSFCIEYYASGAVSGYGFNLLCPCSWCFEFFSSGAPAVFLREWYVGYVTPCRVLVVVLITSFLPSVRGLSSCSLMRAQGLFCSLSGEHWVSVHCGAGLLAPAE